MRRLSIIMVFVFCTLTATAQKFAGGSGTQGDPYLIETAEHLDSLRYYCGIVNSNVYFKIIDNISLSQFIDNDATRRVRGWEPIEGTGSNLGTEKAFCAKLDGGGKVITGLWVNRSSSAGLFMYLGKGAVIENLGIEIHTKGIKGNRNVGGIVGQKIGGTIKSCYVSGKIEGTNSVGGIVGVQETGLLSDCYCKNCEVKGSENVGGIAALVVADTMMNCYFLGTVSVRDSVRGCITSRSASSMIFSCFFDTDVSRYNKGIEFGVPNHTYRVYGKTSTEMMKKVTFTDENWDFNNVWQINNGYTYPFFKWQSCEPVITISGADTTCLKTTIRYETEGNMYDYEWNVSSGGKVVDGGDLNSNTVTVLWESLNNQKVSVNYRTDAGCTAIQPYELDVFVEPLTEIIREPEVPNMLSIGETLSLSVDAVGVSLSYQWQKNGMDIMNESNSTLRIDNIDKPNEGKYKVIVTGKCGQVFSTELTVKIGKIIRIEVPGSLGDSLTNYKSTPIITINGVIDARDIQYLRDSLTGLEDLDLSDVKIVYYSGALGTRYGKEMEYPDDEMPMYSFNTGPPYWEGSKTLKNISLPKNLSSVKNFAFYRCDSIKEFNFPEILVELGSMAFANCRSVKDLKFPNSLKRIDYACFSSCISLEKIKFNDLIEEIGEHAFYYCSNLKELDFTDNLASIGSNAFEKCIKLSSVSFPKRLTLISDSAFLDCSELTLIVNQNPSPQNISLSVFQNVDKKNCKLKVPETSLDSYKNAFVWKDFLSIEGFVGVKNPLQKEMFKVYPNPTTGKVFIEWEDQMLPDLKIYNIQGKLIKEKMKSREIDISPFPDGVYLLQINGYYPLRIIKRKP